MDSVMMVVIRDFLRNYKIAIISLTVYLQLFQERLSEKVHVTIPKVFWVVLSSLFFKEI